MAESDFIARGGCRCDNNPVRYEYTSRPAEVHYCACTDCTDVSGGALAILAVVEKDSFRYTQGREKLKTFDTKPTAHRTFCSECGCHMQVHVDGFPDLELLHVPTVDRDSDVGGKPDRWVFVNSKHDMLNLPDDGLPRHRGWAMSGDPVAEA